ncbi:MAG: phage Gp37/Gp68 family protein [Opitutales bacterium]|nr:phage Gp37/Gp68 family protein [Opitutales bacterium]
MFTWNPWHGCRKFSEGCENCYMYYLDKTRGNDGSKIYKVKTNFYLPVARSRDKAYKVPAGTQVHVCLTSDFFLEEADKWREECWQMMKTRQDLEFFLITKRANRIRECLPPDWGDSGYPNVTLTITAENQKRADERIPILLAVPAAHKGVMVAPFIAPVNLETYLASAKIEFVYADGENYEGTRPLHYEWVKSLSEQCARHKVPFEFFGTGNVFVKDGREYHICKAYQRIQAARSNLSFPPSDPATLPRMNPRCATCPRNAQCNGCRNCGKCKF